VGKAKKVIASAIVISGATALSSIDAEAAEHDTTEMLEDDLREIEQMLMEQALRKYANPLKRIQAELAQPTDPYVIYEVQEGDTLSHIAQDFGVKVQDLVEHNGINNRHLISIGQKIRIPLYEKQYVVKLGDTLHSIAQQHGVMVDDLVAFNPLLLSESDHVLPGQELMIPTAPPEPVHQPLATPRRNNKDEQVMIASRSESVHSYGFIWPVQGTITSRFGMRWGRPHNGIDIANRNQATAPIMAAQSGVVTDAYFNRGGYGNLVIIEHGEGVKTYYAHLSQISVAEGQHVSQGEVIGYMGRTGHATGYHLHFEIHLNNRPVNPERYLP
jgi:murein DD-endopeptidase MepM/ murein hydrolase activator NlpD